MKPFSIIFLIVAITSISLLILMNYRNEKTKTIPEYLYKITTPELWQQSQKESVLILAKMDTDFIHLSEKDSVEKIIKKFFADQQKVVILKIDPTKLEGQLVKEKNPGGNREYFHLYNGRIPLKSIMEITKKNTENL